MNSAINVREAELMEAIRINNSVIKQLEKENRELKEEYANFKKQASEDMKEITKDQVENINLFDKLGEENKKLNLQIAELMGQRDGKQMLIDMLETQNKELIRRIKGHVPTQILADFRHTMSDLHNKFKK